MAADELGGRVHDDVGAVAEGLGQIGRGHRVVDHQGDAGARGRRPTRPRSRGRRPWGCRWSRRRRPWCWAGRRPARRRGRRVVDEADLDPELGQGVVEQVVGAPVERGRRDDVAAVLGQVQQGDGLGRLAAGHGQRGHPAFEGGHPLLEDRLGGVHDPGVDVAQLLQAEEGGGVGGVPEGVAGGLVDGHGPGPGGGVGHGTGMDLAGFESPVGHGGGLPCPGPQARLAHGGTGI